MKKFVLKFILFLLPYKLTLNILFRKDIPLWCIKYLLILRISNNLRSKLIEYGETHYKSFIKNLKINNEEYFFTLITIKLLYKFYKIKLCKKILNHIIKNAKNSQNFKLYKILLKKELLHSNTSVNYLKIANLFAEGNNVLLASQYYNLSTIHGTLYNTIKYLNFELEYNLPSSNFLIEKIIQAPFNKIIKFLPMLERTKVLLNNKKLINYINYNYKSFVINKNLNLNLSNDEYLKILLKLRLISQYKKTVTNLKLKDNYEDKINKIPGFILDLIDIANNNEQHSNNYFGFDTTKKSTISIKKEDIKNNTYYKFIELSIPTVFFTFFSDEKPSYKTIIEFYIKMINAMNCTNQVVIIPFHQWNWRNYNRNLPCIPCISYHTNASKDDLNHYHLQENTFNKRCSLDVQGFAGFSSLSDMDNSQLLLNKIKNQDPLIVEENYKRLLNNCLYNDLSKYAQNSKINFNLDSKFIFVPLQIPTDVVSNLCFISTENLLKQIVPIAIHNNIKVVVKKHPYNNSYKIDALVKHLKRTQQIIVTTASIHKIVANKNCLAIFTANSGSGLEALIHLKPVYITGKSDYQLVCQSIKNNDELASSFKNGFKTNTTLIKQFLSFYINSYAIHVNDKEKIQEVITNILNIGK